MLHPRVFSLIGVTVAIVFFIAVVVELTNVTGAAWFAQHHKQLSIHQTGQQRGVSVTTARNSRQLSSSAAASASASILRKPSMITSASKHQRLLASTSPSNTAHGGGNVLRRTFRRVRASWTSQDYTRDELKIGIAGFYDRSSLLWENVWGEHMHHGYYLPANRTDHVQAQIDLIDQVLHWAKVDSANNVVDVGCGIGGSSRHIARKFNCRTVEGITLSPYQANRGNELAIEQNVASTCHFQVADALEMPFPNNTFDLVWSLESGEHMPDKQQFVSELFRVATPGGRIIIVTWCHRDLQPNETSLSPSELRLLRRINRAYYLPQWCSVQDYVTILTDIGATDIRREDWSYIIAPFWKAVIRSSLNLKSIWGLLRSGFSTQRGAYAMFLMLSGFNKGLIKFGLLTCSKPK